MTKLHEITVRLSPLDYYIIRTLNKEGISSVDIVTRAKRIIEFISKKQETSEVVEISGETVNGFSRTALVFGGQINLNLKYYIKIGLWPFLCSAYNQIKNRVFDISVVCDEDFFLDLDRLTQQYESNHPKYLRVGIINIGLRIYFEMYCGVQYESIFKINGVDVTGILS